MKFTIRAEAVEGVARVIEYRVRVPQLGKHENPQSDAVVAIGLRKIADELDARSLPQMNVQGDGSPDKKSQPAK